MKKTFKFGVLTGLAVSAVALVSSALGYRQLVVKPEQEAEENYDKVSKAAVRRSVAAHQSRY
ncbi:DUF3042 family protein [Convivina intestini]|uniref:DUF3042 family protein n=1 Tax=Convivina intestini TaxID=1505726 RepID=A0A2U1D9A7_9LACO|nr:DUF3042 family protein [Convivina intestini]PVY84237.1 hypothetical protein C7384_105116 [Convivina intestini]CAH1854000.1 hypothetical protein R077811_00807 [Convivina intestini]CAH1856410.1 hypothetical protein R078131_01406 [Convivina intestini]SDB90220.1 Protein of unknown function [Leuconostocaceae bacterium R-53105]